MNTTLDAALDYYKRHNCALFPIPAGQKAPTGIIASWKKDYSTDPNQWHAWQNSHPGCNFGIVAFASNLIIIDVDTSPDKDFFAADPEGAVAAARTEAWSLWVDLCQSWGIPVASPQIQSARGGWHVYFQVPPHIDAATLRQPDAIKKRINVRCLGFTVAAGSYYDGTVKQEQSGSYLLLSDAAPYPAPDALVEHCTRATTREASPVTSDYDLTDMAKLVEWLAERDCFEPYEDWCSIGMALKLAAGDDGYSLWELTHDDTVTDDIAATKWNSFASTPEPGCVTLQTWLQTAHRLGWSGTIRKSTSSMFSGVAAIAAAAGATLASAPTPVQGLPMLAGQEALARLGAADVDAFLASTQDLPTRPQASDYPTLPEGCSGHGLYRPLKDAINRIFCLAETGKYKSVAATGVLTVLSLVHAETYAATIARLQAMGHSVSIAEIKRRSNRMSENVQRDAVERNDWVRDQKSEPQGDNSDNITYMLRYLECEVRWNAWFERMEIKGGKNVGAAPIEWTDWTYVDDPVIAMLRSHVNRTHIRFRPGRDFTWDSLLYLAKQNVVDPVLDELDGLVWDGAPRLSYWLQRACGVPDDLYHRAVSRNIIGGIVSRVRNPGVKFDTMAILCGSQGTGKSTLVSMLALRPEYFDDSIELGEASKELVLSLAGKMVVEIGEMGMKSSASAAHIKAMVSRQVDRGRTAYARAVTERARRNLFVGTTNEDQPLQDPTGNRRFLPVSCNKPIDLDWLKANLSQIYAEAVQCHAAGETFHLPPDVWGLAAQYQEAARTETDVETMMHEWFAPGEFSQVAYLTAADLVTLTKLAGWNHGNSNTNRGRALANMGFRGEMLTVNGKRGRAWARAPLDMQPADIVKHGVRYMVRPDSNTGLPVVTISKIS